MVESTQNKILYIIGESRSFPFNYKFFKPEDIHLFLEADDSGNNPSSELVQGVDYSVEVKEDYSDGAVITLLLDPMPVGRTLAICRICDLLQQLSLLEHGKLPSKPIEADFDKIFMVLQQQQEQLDRSFKIDITTSYDPLEYFKNLKTVTVNAKDVALNAADSAAQSALAASISERNMSLIWAELTGDPTLAENALVTVKEAAEASGAIKVAKEIAVGEIQNIGATAIAATQQAAKEATDAANAATNTADAISGTIADELSVQISQAVGADGALGAAIAGGIKDVEDARQNALDKANQTLAGINKGSSDFSAAKEQALAQIQSKVDGVSLDVQTVLAKAQVIADNYLDDARATVSGSLDDLEQMKQQAIAAGKSELVAIINKRIEELNILAGYLEDASSAADAAQQFKNAASSAAGDASGFASAAAGSLAAANKAVSDAQGFSGSASTYAQNALKSAQDAALKASDAEASALAAGAAANAAATSAAEKSITAHNANSQAHQSLFNSKLSLSGGTMTGALKFSGGACFIGSATDSEDVVIVGGNAWGKGATITLSGNSKSSNAGDMYFYTFKDNGNANILAFGKNGNFHLNSKHIVRSVDGALADAAGNVSLNALKSSGGMLNGILISTVDDVIRQYTSSRLTTILGGSGYDSGASLILIGTQNTTSDNPGGFMLRGIDKNGTSCALVGTPQGGIQWNGADLIRMPNYVAGTEQFNVSRYTAILDCWIQANAGPYGDVLFRFYVNEHVVAVVGETEYGNAFFPMRKGDVLTLTVNGVAKPINSLRIYPMV